MDLFPPGYNWFKDKLQLVAPDARFGAFEQFLDEDHPHRKLFVIVLTRRYAEAERWIREGLRAIKDKWPGTAARLNSHLREIRKRQKNWLAVAAIQAEEFVRQPSRQTFTESKKAAGKVKAWPVVCERLLMYLENGESPWKQ